MDQDKFIKDWMEGKIDPDKLNGSSDDDGQKLAKELGGIIEKSGRLEAPSNKSKAEAWDDLMSKVDNQEDGPIDSQQGNLSIDEVREAKSFSIKRYIPLGIAASLLIIALAYFLRTNDLIIESGNGTQLSQVLPDGSKVTLNSGSRITFAASGFKSKREVTLEGEAFFEVVPGNSFLVTGKQGSIEVLGTSFNAYFREDDIRVSCFTGSVLVKRGSSDQKLSPGQVTKSDDNNMLIAPTVFDTKKTATWRSGEFYFDQTPLSQVIEELERQFDIDVVHDVKSDRIYNGYFNNQDLDEALQLVFRPMSLDFSLKGNKVVVQ